MTTVAMIGVGKLGQDCAEVMALHYDVVGYDLAERHPTFPMKQSIKEAVEGRDLIFIAAPTGHDPIYGGETPTSHLPNKDFDYTVVTGILTEVNKYVTKGQLVVLISTVLPGTVRNILEPCITNARFIYNPYLIAMGTTKWDMINPEMVIIGTDDGSLTGDAEELIAFYRKFMANDPRYEVGTWDEAESIKIFYNTFISTKVALVNMIQDVAETNGNINVDVVTDALKRSTQRITGPSYMTAAMGDGGACHPRDNIALRYLADRLDLGYDLFDAIMKAREVQAERMALRCLRNGKNITIIGKAYKPMVPYLNGSGSLLVGHYIEKHGGNVKYYDIHTGDIDLLESWTHVYLIGYWEQYVEDAVSVLPSHATIIDPWRHGIKNTERSGRPAVINYGNTRPTLPRRFEKPEVIADTITQFKDTHPGAASRLDELCIIEESAYTHLPAEDIVNIIRASFKAGARKVIFNCPAETILSFEIRKLHIVIDLLTELSANDFILVTGAYDGAEVYNKLVAEIGRQPALQVISAHLFEQGSQNNIAHLNRSADKTVTDYMQSPYKVAIKPKVFNCFNKVHRPHRILLLVEMIKAGLLSKSFYSFEGAWPSWIDDLNNGSIDPHAAAVIQVNRNIFPLRLNITPERTNPVFTEESDFVYYTDSYFSVITETLFFSKTSGKEYLVSIEDSVFLSEKIFKPIIMKHPFIVAGFPGTIKALHGRGYKTFHPFIDESYDSETDDHLRLQMITAEIKRLSAFSDEQWLVWQESIKSIVEFNYEVLKNKTVSDESLSLIL